MPGLAEGYEEFHIPRGPFHDSTPIHLVTTATLARLSRRYPGGRFEAARFRPNLLLETDEENGFVEQTWIGTTLAIGDVKVRITRPWARCVMTTLAQGRLPEDRGILATVIAEAEGDVGVKGPVVQGGIVRRGQRVRIE